MIHDLSKHWNWHKSLELHGNCQKTPIWGCCIGTTVWTRATFSLNQMSHVKQTICRSSFCFAHRCMKKKRLYECIIGSDESFSLSALPQYLDYCSCENITVFLPEVLSTWDPSSRNKRASLHVPLQQGNAASTQIHTAPSPGKMWICFCSHTKRALL